MTIRVITGSFSIPKMLNPICKCHLLSSNIYIHHVYSINQNSQQQINKTFSVAYIDIHNFYIK